MPIALQEFKVTPVTYEATLTYWDNIGPSFPHGARRRPTGLTDVQLLIRVPDAAVAHQNFLHFEDFLIALLPHLEPTEIQRLLAAAARQRLRGTHRNE